MALTLKSFLSLSCAIVTVYAGDYIPAVKRDVGLVERAAPGGWAISAVTCPASTTACDSNTMGGSCCPSDLTCTGAGLGLGVACCPNDNDCTPPLVSVPSCANSSWILYEGAGSGPADSFFCCNPDEVGTFNKKGLSDTIGLCLPAGTKVDKSASATLASAAATSAAVTSSTSSKTSSSATTSGPIIGTPKPAGVGDGVGKPNTNAGVTIQVALATLAAGVLSTLCAKLLM